MDWIITVQLSCIQCLILQISAQQMVILPRFLRNILNDERWLVFLVMLILAAHVIGLVVIVLFY